MRPFRMLAAAALAALALPALACAADPARALLVVSSHGTAGENALPGFEMDELSQIYLVLADNGFDVQIASPSGGKVNPDSFDATKVYNARFAADETASARLESTLSLGVAAGGDFDAVVVIGGKGATFDLAKDTALHALLARTEAAGGVIAALCHGVAPLAYITKDDGTAYIAGRRVTGFTAEEDQLFNKASEGRLPMKVEDELRRAGAVFGEAAILLPHVETDGRLVTGQNPYSAAEMAEAVLTAAGRMPEAREPFPDERSMRLVEQLGASGLDAARKELADRTALYDIPLIAIWGYYRTLQAGDDRHMLDEGLTVMSLAEPYFPEPMMQIAMAEAELKLDRKESAVRRLEALLAGHPDLKDAKALLDKARS